MEAIEKTLDYAKNGGPNCSRAIMAAFGDVWGIDFGAAKRLFENSRIRAIFFSHEYHPTPSG